MTSETYAEGSRRELTAGGIIIIVRSCLSALLLIAALIYALGTGRTAQAALAAADCEPTLSPSMQQCTTQPILAVSTGADNAGQPAAERPTRPPTPRAKGITSPSPRRR